MLNHMWQKQLWVCRFLALYSNVPAALAKLSIIWIITLPLNFSWDKKNLKNIICISLFILSHGDKERKKSNSTVWIQYCNFSKLYRNYSNCPSFSDWEVQKVLFQLLLLLVLLLEVIIVIIIMFNNCTINSNILIVYPAGHDLSYSVSAYSRAAGII